jgi:hypothetical protein
MLKLLYIIHKHSVRTSQRTHRASMRNRSWRMLYRELMANCCGCFLNTTWDRQRLCGQNEDFNPGGKYANHLKYLKLMCKIAEWIVLDANVVYVDEFICITFYVLSNIVWKPDDGQLWLKHVATFWVNIVALDGLFKDLLLNINLHHSDIFIFMSGWCTENKLQLGICEIWSGKQRKWLRRCQFE